jgi:radical SAM superfamily enzyme YgiQ (UPF0313 family)
VEYIQSRLPMPSWQARNCMGSKILLISANRCTAPDPVFPLGLAHVNAALRQAGHDTLWTDSLVGEERIEDVLMRYQPDFIGISLRNIDDVLIRKRETFFDRLVSLVATIRQKTNCPVILGGSGFSIFPQHLLELAGADFGVCGEGEAGFVSLIAALQNGRDATAIPGLVYRQDGKIAANATVVHPFEFALNDIDRPASITAHYLQQAGGMLNVQTQRGCGFRCCYCTYPLIEGKQHRRRPAGIVADEFEQLQRLGAKYVFIVDSVFNSSPDHVAEICEAIVRRNLKISWGCFLRPRGLTPELMKLMVRSGLTHIEFGSDSLCDEVLDAYQKGFTFADVLESSKLAAQEKIDYCHFLICGGPGETRDTLQAAFENSKRLPGAVFMAVVGMRIYPGTQLFERAVAEGCIHRDVDLLSPAYYLAPGLTAEGVFEQLQEFSRLSPSWIPGDPGPGYLSLIERLRKRGVVGPLWGYFSLIQRLWPQSIPAATKL